MENCAQCNKCHAIGRLYSDEKAKSCAESNERRAIVWIMYGNPLSSRARPTECVTALLMRNSGIGILKPKSTKPQFSKIMTSSPVGTYLRFLRRKSGLRQRDLARILGSVPSQISRHERSRSLPTLMAAFGYQVVFGKPVSEIFPGLYHAVEMSIEERLEEFTNTIGGGGKDDRPATHEI